jgi:ABC-type phosphate transport system substrate-binding protein
MALDGVPRCASICAAWAGICAGAWGCGLVLDSGKYRCVLVDAQAASDGGGSDAGLSADACSPGQDRPSLEQACTSAVCEPYTGTLPSCDGGLCPLPAPSATPDAAVASGDAATDATAGMSCTAVQSDPGNIIFVTGSTALKGFIQEVSRVLALQPTDPVTVVYQASGSCFGVKAAIDPFNNPLVPSAGIATYYNANGDLLTCIPDPSGRVVADMGASDVFFSTCYMGEQITPTLPQDIADNFGPVQVMNFAVPQGSTQHSISLNAAYYVFGFGGSPYTVPPWTDPMQLQIRNAASGTQSMIAAAIGVPAGRWKGVDNATSGAVGSALVAAGQSASALTVDSALGILASDYLVQNAETLRGLAVEDENTTCAYYPNSTATARDQANVRDGHYPLWGPSHFYARVNPQTHIALKPGATRFIDGISAIVPVPGLDLIAEYASKGLVPLCAMHVARTGDGGNYEPYSTPTTCNCYFDLIATGSTTCKPCSTNADCPTSSPNCNKFGPPPQQGYCDL